ncbi:MAG TPA: hypothetical protein VEZ12_00750 [Herpetosiphonaceae bacterium]|nr:hypothetical protein [Herpetosiphonaceae bacterium]
MKTADVVIVGAGVNRRSPLNAASRSDTTLPQALLMRLSQRSGAACFDIGAEGGLQGAQSQADARGDDALPLPDSGALWPGR